MPVIARNAVWWALCAALAVVAASLQVDRESRRKPGLADEVPAAFRSFAQVHLALRALRAQDTELALERAKELVERRPVPAEHIAILSLAAAQDNDAQLANSAIEISSLRGWRVPLAQHVVAIAAAQSGQWDVAGDRVLALWRASADEAVLSEATAGLLSEAGGREAFARRLAQELDFRGRFVRRGAEYAATGDYADTLAQAIRLGGAVDCADLSEAARGLLKGGAGEAARTAWTGPCTGSAAQGAETSWAFVQDDQERATGPFSWTYPSESGVRLTWRETPQGWVVDYANRDPLRAVLAEKYFMLPAGSHRVTVLSDETGVRQHRVEIRAWCISGNGERRRIAGGADSVTINVPGQACPVQEVRIRVPRGEQSGVRLVSG